MSRDGVGFKFVATPNGQNMSKQWNSGWLFQPEIIPFAYNESFLPIGAPMFDPYPMNAQIYSIIYIYIYVCNIYIWLYMYILYIYLKKTVSLLSGLLYALIYWS